MPIFDEIHQISAESEDMENALKNVLHWIKVQYGQALWVCSIYGNRWSFKAGNSKIPMSIHRMKINQNWGVIMNNIVIPKAEWDSICCALDSEILDKLKKEHAFS